MAGERTRCGRARAQTGRRERPFRSSPGKLSGHHPRLSGRHLASGSGVQPPVRTTFPVPGRPHRVALAVLGCLAASSGTGLAATLVSCVPGQPTESPRLLTSGEAGRLAQVRFANHRDGHAGLAAVAGTAEGPVRVTGWVDWRQQLIYASVQGPATSPDRGLLQATPAVLAVRPTPPLSGDAVAAPPPVRPPADGWWVRPLAESRSAPVHSLLALIFAAAADRPDDATALREAGARWLGRDRIGDTAVDVLVGPAPTAASSARYWLDDAGRLQRLEAMLPGQIPARVDFDRSPHPELVPIAALGGARVDPRPVDRAEARLLAGMRPARRMRSGATANGATVALNLPTAEPAGAGRPADASTRAVHLRGSGWITWSGATAYLAVHGQDRTATPFLLRADRHGVATLATPHHPTPKGSSDVGLPPLPPPADRVWSYRGWRQTGDDAETHDLDLLVEAALHAGLRTDRDLTRRAFRLRQDSIDAQRVTVFEIRQPTEEATTPPGQGRLRYWVDRTGALHRVELRTRTGAFAQLDIVPAWVPRLPRVPVG